MLSNVPSWSELSNSCTQVNGETSVSLLRQLDPAYLTRPLVISFISICKNLFSFKVDIYMSLIK